MRQSTEMVEAVLYKTYAEQTKPLFTMNGRVQLAHNKCAKKVTDERF